MQINYQIRQQQQAYPQSYMSQSQYYPPQPVPGFIPGEVELLEDEEQVRPGHVTPDARKEGRSRRRRLRTTSTTRCHASLRLLSPRSPVPAPADRYR